MVQTFNRSRLDQPSEPDRQLGEVFSFPDGTLLEVEQATPYESPMVTELDGIAKVLAIHAKEGVNPDFLRGELKGHSYAPSIVVDGEYITARLIFSIPTTSKEKEDEGTADTLLLTTDGRFVSSIAQHEQLPRRRANRDHPMVLTWSLKEATWSSVDITEMPEEHQQAIEAFLDSEVESDNDGSNIIFRAREENKTMTELEKEEQR